MSFHPVAIHVNDVPITVARLRTGEETPLINEDTALTAMVDFHWVCPATVEPEQKITAALQNMIGARVRTLLVMSDAHMVGLITAYDIQGQKPLQFLHGSDCIHPQCRHEDIEVADIMTSVEALPTLCFADVHKARIGDIVETFRKAQQTHLLVTDQQEGQRIVIRGLISRTEIERRLGVSSAQASTARIAREASIFSLLATQA